MPLAKPSRLLWAIHRCGNRFQKEYVHPTQTNQASTSEMDRYMPKSGQGESTSKYGREFWCFSFSGPQWAAGATWEFGGF